MIIDGGNGQGRRAGGDPPGILDASHEALEFLDRHRLARTTISYALALQAVLHPYGPLGGEVARRTDGGVRLTEDDVRELMPLVREHEVTDLGLGRLQMERDLGEQAETLEALTSDARAITSDFSHQVTALSHAHRRSNDLGPDTGAIALLFEQLIARISKTERDLEELAGNIAGLRTRMEPGEADDRIDPLTGVTSRVGARAMVEALVAEPHGYVVAACSLDDLEGINERYGRSVADNVLRAFVATLRQSCEGADIVRWQGNLFLIILRGRPLSTLTGMMEDARTAMRERTLRLRGTGEPIGAVTISGGVAVGVGVPMEDVLARAEMLRDMASAGLGNRILSRA
ncbi:GGDEF domain-containing protein [Sphingomonas fuzhouensis]|uniref:GGDEF domain-containing protein n=1 Tax=Sphingomonas fuzhouensis TaxID=3106033 RepID=UPI002AFEC9D1|nr:diguanylate cyclase [Sphingomonas sp. SGZ-02]